MKNNKIKNILNNDDDTDFEYNSENENLEDENNYIYEENIKNTALNLQNKLLEFVEKKNLPLCEYLSISNIELFISSMIN